MNKNKAEELDLQQEAPQEQMSLDDSRRVKVLSPGMLVFKRFIRNKLAVVGIFILVVMFLFSFLGPTFSPYDRDQVFKIEVQESGDYASGKINTSPRFYGNLSAAAQTGVLREIGTTSIMGSYVLRPNQEFNFDADGQQYTIRVLNASPTEPSCAIYGMQHIATVRMGNLKFYDPSVVDSDMLDVIRQHAESKSEATEITYKDMTISVIIGKVDTKYFIPSDQPVALSTYNIYTNLNGKVTALQSDPDFMGDLSKAVMSGLTEVQDVNGKLYTVVDAEDGTRKLVDASGEELFLIQRDLHYSLVDNPDLSVSEGADSTVSFKETIDSENEFISAMDTALRNDEHSFTYDGKTYSLDEMETEIRVLDSDNNLVLEVANKFLPAPTPYEEYKENLYFLFELESAISSGQVLFMYNDDRFTMSREGSDFVVSGPQGYEILLASDIAYGANNVGTDLTVDFVKKLMGAIRNQEEKFSFVNEYGEYVSAEMNVNNGNCYVRTMQTKELINSREGTSSEHVLGTDIFGMDVLTRLMYGGRVSLLVGFVVVFFEIILGVLVGGFSGYFGGVTDTILMRVVELFNCIPFYPMLLILGSVLDAQRASSTSRLLLTMVILGVLSWTGVARIVRGQILSLREQDFMVATESTGIRTSRRIFKHLIPNVMPLLIVEATQSLGSIILTEATLGYLGLGVKYPMVSWGSIVNQATDMQVMSTAWWIWIPAGLLILTTVLGFNFVGDGLRDAFDPKMKR